MNKNILYHGSSKLIENYLDPRPSNVLNKEEAVFATNDRILSLVFIPKWTDSDFSLGYYKDKLYMLELYPNAFDLLKDKSGYIYEVNSEGFKKDDRLGMQKHEFINNNKVKILNTTYIEDVYKELIKMKMNMIEFNEMIESLYENKLIK